MNKILFKHSLLSGDLLNNLAGIKHYCETHNTKAEIMLGLDIEWRMADEIAKGRVSKVTLTKDTLEAFRPLLLSQPYIDSVTSFEERMPEEYRAWCEMFRDNCDVKTAAKWYNRKALDKDYVDLDKHHLVPCGVPYGNIFRWAWYCYPDLACDLSKPWLFVDPDEDMPSNTIAINRTERCRNESIDYSFLSKYKGRLLFLGNYQEWLKFRQDTGMELPLFTARNYLDLARVIGACSFFMGNQSLCFSLAEAMKVPRILEVYSGLPNVIPSGDLAFDFYHQHGLEYYVELLANRK